MSEKETSFDRLMIDSLSELPPTEAEIQLTNPWSKPIGFITWGLILTTLHLDMLHLQYILPTVGIILLFLGCRSLRNENIYFKAAWILSIIKLVLGLGSAVILSTPLNNTVLPEFVAGMIGFSFQISMLLVFHAALKQTCRRAGKAMERAPLLWTALWTAAAFLIALSPLAHSWAAFLPMVLFYILIIRSLYRIGPELDDVGYIFTNAPVRISNKTFGSAYFLTALIIVTACSFYFNHLQLEAREYRMPEITETRQQLIDMGFPHEALQYLSDDVVSSLKATVNITAFEELLMFDPKEVEHREEYGTSTQITVTREPGQKNVKASTLYIEMPENTVYVMQYFIWESGLPIWQDAVHIAGDNQAESLQLVSSELFFEKKGITYTADFPRLVCGKMTQTGMFGTTNYEQILGALSYPFGSKAQGGYVLYRYALPASDNRYATISLLDYVHLLSPLHFPYVDTEERLLKGEYSFSDARQQHYTNYDSLALREINP